MSALTASLAAGVVLLVAAGWFFREAMEHDRMTTAFSLIGAAAACIGIAVGLLK